QEVDRQLQATISQLSAEIPNAKDAKEKKALEEELMQAEFDLGVNRLEREDFTGARGMFDKVALKKDTDPPLALLGRAWIARCMQHSGDDPVKVMDAYKSIDADRAAGTGSAR